MHQTLNFETFTNLSKQFIVHLQVERRLAENTVKSYAGDLYQLEKFWSALPEQEQQKESFRRIIERYLLSVHYKKMDRASIARRLSCFKSFERFLLTQGISLKLDIKRPRIARKLPSHLSMDEITFLLDGISDDDLNTKYPLRTRVILELLYATGVRCSELTNIQFGDIDFQQKTIRIRGKGGKERFALFGSKAHDKMQEYLSKERPAINNATDTLLVNYRGQRITTRSIQRIFVALKKLLPLQRSLTPHKIRHTFATHMLSQGVDLRVVQELLGHSTISSTELYTHVSLAQLAQTCQEKHPISLILDPE